MTDIVRWGVLSTANINKALLDPIRQAKRSELAAVASRSLDRAQAYAAEQGIPTAHGSYEDLLADPGVDAVYISLPNSLHCEWTVKAAEAGKHVLCEKPLVTNLADMERVEAAARDNGVTIVEAFMYQHHPQTLKVRELLGAGKVGQLQQINSWFHFYLPPERSENIRLSQDLEGGSLWDVGVYPNSMAVLMAAAGAPQAVWADQITGETGVDVAMRAQMRFANGVIAQISCGFRTPAREATYIVGDAGELHIVESWKPGLSGQESHVRFTGRDGSTETITTPAVDPYLCEVQAMEASILDGAEPVVPLRLSRDFLRSVLALYESAATGNVVHLDS